MLTGGHGFPSFNVLPGGEASEVLVVVLAPVTQMEVQYFEKGLAVWSVSQHRWQLRIRPSVDSRAPKQGRGARCPRGLALPARTRLGVSVTGRSCRKMLALPRVPGLLLTSLRI